MSSLGEMSEEALLSAVREAHAARSAETRAAGRAALEQLLERNYDWIMRMCLAEFGSSAAADDCSQEVLLRISKGISSFKGDSKLSTWIFVILKRTIADVRRKSLRQNQRFALEGEDSKLEVLSAHSTAAQELRQESPERRVLDEEQREGVLELVRSLPGKQRQAVLLHYFEDLSVEEAAGRMDCSVSSLKTHLFRARKKLAELLPQKD